MYNLFISNDIIKTELGYNTISNYLIKFLFKELTQDFNLNLSFVKIVVSL